MIADDAFVGAGVRFDGLLRCWGGHLEVFMLVFWRIVGHIYLQILATVYCEGCREDGTRPRISVGNAVDTLVEVAVAEMEQRKGLGIWCNDVK